MSGLTKIGSKSNQSKQTSKPFIQRYFGSAALFGFIGSAWLGAHLWLMLNGEMTIPPSYTFQKILHIKIQFFAFLGMFILGFSFHAAPPVLKVDLPSPRLSAWLWILPLLGIAYLFFSPDSKVAHGVIALPYLIASAFVLRCSIKAKNQARLAIGVPLASGLLVLTAACFIDLEVPLYAEQIFLYGVIAIIYATSQQFITGFLGGKMLSESAALFFWGAYLIAGLCIFFDEALWGLQIYLQAFLCFSYLYLTGAAKGALSNFSRSALAQSYLLGFCWYLLGLYLLLGGPSYADQALHAWALGLAIPLTITTSSQIIEFLSGRAVLSFRILSFLIILWQLVPIARVLNNYLTLGPLWAWVLSFVVTVVIFVWGLKLLQACIRMERKR